jgi:hypothetical protein
MIMSINSKKLFCFVLLNFFISFSTVLFIKYCSRYLDGILHYMGLYLHAPSFFILVVILGPNNAVHFTRQITYDIVSFMFFSFVIAIAQIIYIKIKDLRIIE